MEYPSEAGGRLRGKIGDRSYHETKLSVRHLEARVQVQDSCMDKVTSLWGAPMVGSGKICLPLFGPRQTVLTTCPSLGSKYTLHQALI